MKQYATLKLEDLNQREELDYINSIWYGIMTMDTVLLDRILDDTIDYEDIGKEKFIEKLSDQFYLHKDLGDTSLELDLNYCNGCNNNQPVCTFIGNNSGRHFSLYFDILESTIKDIYHCNWYCVNM